MVHKNRIAIFGASGTIGQALVKWFSLREWEVLALTRKGNPPEGSIFSPLVCWAPCDPINSIYPSTFLGETLSLNAAIWAQGKNFNDNIYQFDPVTHEEIYRANVLYILQTLEFLITGHYLISQSRLCIISSIWQKIARQNKLSYTITKAALQGLVMSASLDLGRDGHLLNAILPGALDTPMTRKNLNEEQIKKIESSTLYNRLATLEDICNTAGFLCSQENTGLTGQFITVDLGFSYARIL